MGAAAVMPKRIVSSLDPIKERFVGTGPYRLVEHMPDRYIRVVPFGTNTPPPGQAERLPRRAEGVLIDELRFIPVPNTATRVDGLLTGQVTHFADGLTIESYQKLSEQTHHVKQGTMIVPGWAIIVMNTKAGRLPPTCAYASQAALAAISPSDMLAAAFGPPSVWTLEGSIYPKGTELYIADTPGYNAHDPAKAAAMLKEAGYSGKPFRIFTTMQYDYMYKIAQVAEANLTEAGFKVELIVMDWATLLQAAQWTPASGKRS